MALTRNLNEPGWHRRLRTVRSKVRAAFNCNDWKLWSHQKIRRAANFLDSHHGSQIPSRVQRTILGERAFPMASNSWTCRFCSTQMTLIVAHCSVCKRHWKQAQQGAASRSKSRKAKKAKDTRKPEDKNSKGAAADSEKTKTEDKDFFGGQHPWVMSSPQPRAVTTTSDKPEEEITKDVALPIPPEVKSSCPPEQNAESVLMHLRGLKKAMGTLPDALEVQLEKLEEQAKDKMLSHGHLNKLSKIQRQLTVLHTRIQEMDSTWQSFAGKVVKRFQEHQQMYRQTRASLLQDFLKKNEELQAAKMEVQLASQTLMQPPMQPPEPPDLDQAVIELEEALQEDGYSDVQDMEEDPELMSEEQKQVLKDKALRPFRSSVRPKMQSPSKVHAGHLKTKEDKK